MGQVKSETFKEATPEAVLIPLRRILLFPSSWPEVLFPGQDFINQTAFFFKGMLAKGHFESLFPSNNVT